MKRKSSQVTNCLKRAFDICFSLGFLMLTSPLFLLVSTAIKLTSSGPIFYAQKRVGRNKKPFFIWKFRTMCVNADAILQDLLQDPLVRNEWEKNWKLKEDPRTTRIGKFLRQKSLDELPQFWNVLKGEMSIVGPRPQVEDEVNQYFKEKAQKILSVRPGITGLWQVSGRNFLSRAERVCLDEHYVDNLSFMLDLHLIAKTIRVIFSSKGAY